MAVDLGKFVGEVKENITLDELSGKTIAVDAYNTIYQFLSIIRQPDGTPLMDSKGRVTSHLSGLLYRTTNLLEFGISPVFVFDGLPPIQKQRTIEARMNRRKEALEGWNKAKAEGMVAEARAFAMASTRITKDVVESAKELLGYMGIPYMQANSEAEAQAAHMVKSGLVYATASQDYDSFLFGSDVVLRNITITGKRKLPKRNVFIDVKPERVMLQKLLSNLGLSINQLI
ncbi:MAG: flap structure-specific endonuclease, partial [Candidatus Micrarchaeota archaeon]|nr:flap structure-specific endonuclease [Candidatus Micrarchaeota archaeon]